jgi:hypothetical protein
MSGFFDWLFKGGMDTTGKKTSQIPGWMENAGKFNYGTAQLLASRPYTPYPFSRIAGFTGDQKDAMGMLRGYAPTAMGAAGKFKVPRLIDNIGKGGSIDAYMNPYIDNVLDRTEQRIDDQTGEALQWSSNASMHGANAFGDARHGIADAQIFQDAGQLKADKAAEGYASAYDNAMGLRNNDINRMYNTEAVNQKRQDQFYDYIDSLYRSGSNQQNLDQKNMDLGYQDFLRQEQYPYDMYNLLQSALSGTPFSKTEIQQEPGTSGGASILGLLGSLGSLFL